MGQDKPGDADKTAEADTATFDSLKNAALNNNFDSAYRKTISQKLESTNALIRELYDKTSDKDLKSILNDAYTHFKLLQNQLAATSS
jgi:predicted outer membrane protein